MIFSGENLQFNIYDAVRLTRQNKSISTTKKTAHALGYRIKGRSSFYFKDRCCEVSEGDLIYIPPFVDYHQKTEFESIVAVDFDIQNAPISEVTIIHLENKELFDKLFIELSNNWNSKKAGYIYKSNSILNDIFYHIKQQLLLSSPGLSAKEKKIISSLEYIKMNYTNSEINIEDISAKSAVSATYFRRIFKELYNISPMKYIIQLRIIYAIELLHNTEYSVSDIANMVGFNDTAYFCQVFKEHTAITPNKYRDEKFSINGEHQ